MSRWPVFVNAPKESYLKGTEKNITPEGKALDHPVFSVRLGFIFWFSNKSNVYADKST